MQGRWQAHAAHVLLDVAAAAAAAGTSGPVWFQSLLRHLHTDQYSQLAHHQQANNAARLHRLFAHVTAVVTES